MGRRTAVALYLLTMVAVIVVLDVLLLEHRFWARLVVNIGIVTVFVAAYFRFLKPPRPPGRGPRSGG